MKHLIQAIFVFSFWFFIAVKVAGTSFAAWSWWWLFPGFNLVPNLSLLVKHLAL